MHLEYGVRVTSANRVGAVDGLWKNPLDHDGPDTNEAAIVTAGGRRRIAVVVRRMSVDTYAMPQRRSTGWSRPVLLVGGDASVGQSCARAAAPLPVVRARRVAIAADRLRAMRPFVIVVAPDVAPNDAAELARLGAREGARVVRLVDEIDDHRLRTLLVG
jgi:hypothetical protein